MTSGQVESSTRQSRAVKREKRSEGRQPRDDRDNEFVDKLVALNRVAKVVKGGRRFGFAALVVIGDQKGRVGFGHGKAREVPEAIRKATEAARRELIFVPLRDGRTLHHDVNGRHGAGKVLLRSAKVGTGIIAGGPMRSVFEMLGMHDVVAKSTGSSNPYNMIRATFDALKRQLHPKDIAAQRGLNYATLQARRAASGHKNPSAESKTIAHVVGTINTDKTLFNPHVKGEARSEEQTAGIADFYDKFDTDKMKALEVASGMLFSARRSDQLVDKSSVTTRAHLAHVARYVLRSVFSSDKQLAGQAAYYLVVNSKGYGQGLDPQARFDQLPATHAEKFRFDLTALLKKQGISFVTLLSAKTISSTDAGDANVEIGVVISKALAFEINGHKVLLGDEEPTHVEEGAFEMGCPIAKERTAFQFTDGDGRETVLSATASFIIPKERIADAIPCVVTSPILTEARKVPVTLATL